MRKISLLLVVFSLFAATIITASAAERERVAPAIQIDENPVLDGRMNEACWQSGEWQTQFLKVPDRTAPAGEIRFKVLNNARGLWFGIAVADESVIARPRPHGEAVWHDDAVEILLAPVAEFPADRNVREIAHFIVNAAGAQYEDYMIGGVADSQWHPDWRCAAQRTQDGYTLEVFIPFSALSDRQLRSGDWRLNIFRVDKGGPANILSAWNFAQSPADGDHFGRLTGVACDARRFHALPDRASFRRAVHAGSTRTELAVAFSAAPNCEYDIAAAIHAPDGRFIALERARAVAGHDGRLQTVLPADFTESGRCQVRLALFDPQGKVFDRRLEIPAELAPLALTVSHPVYRNTLYASERDRTLELDLRINLPEPDRQRSTLEIVLRDADGQIQKQQRVAAPPAEYRYRGDVAGLAPGRIQVEFRIPEVPGAELIHAITIAAAQSAGSEVYIGRDGNLRLNGQPFLIRGFMGAHQNFDDMEKAHCNTVHFYTLNRAEIPEIRARLDECRRRGMYAIFSPFHKTSAGFWGVNHYGEKTPALKFSDAEIARMRTMVNAVKDHPALLGWYLYDEPRGSEWTAELRKMYALLCELDPAHPVFGCDNGSDGCIGKRDACDIAVLDLYLNPTLNGGPARSVAMILAAVERTARNLGPGKLLVYAPQAFDVDSFMAQDFTRIHRPPRPDESCATVFGALAAGARGILAYKIGNPDAARNPAVRHSNAGIYADAELKKAFLEIIMPRLREQETFFLAPGTAEPSRNGVRQWIGRCPDGTQKVLSVGENPPYKIEFASEKK